MRFLEWNTEAQTYECTECDWEQALNVQCSYPAERLELEFKTHGCKDFPQPRAQAA